MKNLVNTRKATVTLNYMDPENPGNPKKLRLEIGANAVDEKVIAACRANPYQNRMFKRMLILREVEKPVASLDPDTTPDSLGGLKIHDAIRAVKACEDKTQLERWLATDVRKGVREAIITRGMALTQDDDKPAVESDPSEDITEVE